MKKIIIGTYYKDFNQAIEIAEKQSKNGREYSVVPCNEGWLVVVNDNYLPPEATTSPIDERKD